MGETKHDGTANRLARKEQTTYNRGQGPDVLTSRRAIEVETKHTAKDGLRQLKGFTKPVYIAGADPDATKAALEVTKGTTVGVISHTGRVIKRSTRNRK